MIHRTPRTHFGDTTYFEVRLHERQALDLTQHVDLLRQSVRIGQKRRPFHVDAAVILPHRVQMIWTLPPGDSAYSARWHIIKTTFAKHVGSTAGTEVWQRRFWDHALRDQGDFDLHMHLIMTAPVREGLVDKASDWPWSSLHHRAVLAERTPRMPQHLDGDTSWRTRPNARNVDPPPAFA